MSSYPRRTSYASVAAGATPTTHPLFSPAGSAGMSLQQGEASDHSTPQHPSTLGPAGIAEMDGSSKAGALRSQWYHVENAPNTPTVLVPRPSYLKRSRYMERLREQDRRLQKASEEAASQRGKGGAGLGSRQNSSTNLAGMKSRGIVHDVIERLPPLPPEGSVKSLPVKWNELDRCTGLEILGSGLEVKYAGVGRTPDDAAAVRSDSPMPRECGLYYYEVTVLSRGKEGLIGVGFSGSRPSLNRLPGWEQESWGYHGDDGHSFACSASGKPYGPKFSALDVVGCGINFRTGSAFFTKNGIFLGEAFQGIKLERLYPSVGIKKPGEHVRANFGQTPFVFDIDTLFERERKIVQREISNFDVVKQPILADKDETATIHELISQYLGHEGFTETANEFASEVKARHTALHPDDKSPPSLPEPNDFSASHRQKIRSAILEGNIDRAFKYLDAFFPHVLGQDSNRDIYFRLRCRKFIEMILRSYESQSDPHADGFLNGATGNGEVQPVSSEMDVDDGNKPAQNGNPSDEADYMETSVQALQSQRGTSETKQPTMLHNDLLTAAIQYGMELQADFGNDPRREVKKALSDTFALIAYTDARESVLAEMVEGKGRVEIAEQVNGAILVSLGKPRSALLEKLCAQSEVLLDMLSEDGGAGAFVNLQQDYLQ